MYGSGSPYGGHRGPPQPPPPSQHHHYYSQPPPPPPPQHSHSQDTASHDDSPPPIDDANHHPHHKRKRTTKACDICNKRKVKCDGSKPSCNQCTNGHLQCSYEREAKKRGPKQGHLKELESRLKQMEALIKPLADKLPDGALEGVSAEAAAAVASRKRDSPQPAPTPQSNSGPPQYSRGAPHRIEQGAFGYSVPSSAGQSPTPASYPQHPSQMHYGQYPGNAQQHLESSGSLPQNPPSLHPLQQTHHHAGPAGTYGSGGVPTSSTGFIQGFSYGSNPDVMPTQPLRSAFSPTISTVRLSPLQSPRASEDEDIWNIIDRDFDELMGGAPAGANGNAYMPEATTGNAVDSSSGAVGGGAVPGVGVGTAASSSQMFGNMLGSAAYLPDGAGPGLGTAVRAQPRKIPRQLAGPFGEVPLAPQQGAAGPRGAHWWPSDVEEASRIPDDAIEELLDLFFIYMNPILGYMIHEREFRRTLPMQSPLLLNTMYANAARFSGHPSVAKTPEAMWQAGDSFYAKARVLVSQNVDVPSLDTVSSLIMLMTYASGSGRASASWMYSGMAIRMAQSLKMDLDPDFKEVTDAFGPISWFEKERRRRLWWACFLTDRYAAAAADRSTLAQERDVRVFQPVPVWEWVNMTADDHEPKGEAPGTHSRWQLTVLSSTGSTRVRRGGENEDDQKEAGGVLVLGDSSFDAYVELGKIFGRVMEYTSLLKSPTPSLPGLQLISASEADTRFTSLEAALDTWMSALRPWMREPGRTFAANWTHRNADGALSPPSWEVAYLHMFYHTTKVLLHRPKMMQVLNSGGDLLASRHFVASQTAAAAVTDLVEAMMEANPNLFWVTPFACFCLFQTALVHIISAQTFRGDTAAVTAARDCCRSHLRALRGMSRFWLQGKKLEGILSELFKSLDVPADETESGGTPTPAVSSPTVA
ncbi:hypothetical protein HDU89_008253 [Geranomyces variabilis]|nr:hypothetical protein HDU89_008253 [Geranomyces variabilis]